MPEPPPQNSVTSSGFGLYPTLDNMHANQVRGYHSEFEDLSKRTIASLPRTTSHSIPSSRAAYLSNIYGLGPTQYAETPSFASNGDMGHTAMGPSQHNYASFDSLARSKNYVSPATLAPKEFDKKTYRHVAPLGAAISSRSRESAERTEMSEPEELEVDEQTTPKISVRSLLLSDDQADPGLKLPAIHRDSGEIPDRTGLILPSLTELAPSSPRPSSPLRQLPVKRHTEDDILRGVKRLEVSEEQRPREGRVRERERESGRGDMRRKHAVLIRSWLVAVNLEWRRRRLKEAEGSDEDTVVGEAVHHEVEKTEVE